VKPYYESGGITIYHGDCREIEPLAWDAVLTDPPYGIGADRRQSMRAGKRHGAAVAPSRDYGPSTDWDARPADSEMLRALIVKPSIIWGANYFDLPAASKWLVWDKQTGNNGYADAELAWTNLGGAVRTFRHQWMGMLQAASDSGNARVHPTQKPVPLMRWCLEMLPDGIVIDPFLGSGTTLIAAKDLGRRAIGIEIEERYCEIAAERLSQEVLDFGAAA
jgi:DNA modification methylase